MFEELYDLALRRDHARIRQIYEVHRDYEECDLLGCCHVVAGVRECQQQFQEALLDTARQNRMRIRRGRYLCPERRDPDCHGAYFIPEDVVITQAELKAYLQTKFNY